jgi:hypothetical protein
MWPFRFCNNLPMERIVAWVFHDSEIWDAFEVQMGATYLVVITKIRDNPYLWFWAKKSFVSDFPRAQSLAKFKKLVMHKNIRWYETAKKSPNGDDVNKSACIELKCLWYSWRCSLYISPPTASISIGFLLFYSYYYRLQNDINFWISVSLFMSLSPIYVFSVLPLFLLPQHRIILPIRRPMPI